MSSPGDGEGQKHGREPEPEQRVAEREPRLVGDDEVAHDGDGGLLQRNNSPLSPHSAVAASGKMIHHHKPALQRTRTDSLELRTHRNSPRNSDLKELPVLGTAAPTDSSSESQLPRLDSSRRSRSIGEMLQPQDLPPLSPRESGIPEWKPSSALTSMELQPAIAEQQRPRPGRYKTSAYGSTLNLPRGGSTPRPDRSDESLKSTSSNPNAGASDESSNGSHLNEPTTDQEPGGSYWRYCWKHLQRYVVWYIMCTTIGGLLILLVMGGLGCWPHWTGGTNEDLDTTCTGVSSSHQCREKPLLLRSNSTEVDAFIGQLDDKLEHVSRPLSCPRNTALPLHHSAQVVVAMFQLCMHCPTCAQVRKLRTDMDYLRRSTLNEERLKHEHIDQFEHQQREIKRAQEVIAVIQRRLVDLGVVKSSTVLYCDWMDETSMPFQLCSSSGSEHSVDSSNSCPTERGCHIPVQQGHDLKLLEDLLKRDRGPSIGNTDVRGSTNFDCFNSEGSPQGCHAHAMQRLAQARFRVGCARRWQPQLWGWCGKYPWSFMFSSSRPSPSDGYSNPVDDSVDAYHGGCTTLLDIFHRVLDFLINNGVQVSAFVYAWTSLSRSMTALQSGFESAKKGITELQDRASGLHDKKYVNRVSLSLNLLLPIERRQTGTQKYKLLPRTLWEKDLPEIMTDPDQRSSFRAAAHETEEEEPFLRDSQQGSLNEERKVVINLFSNHISSICSTNFILQDLGQTVREEAFVYGLTFEAAWKKEEKENDRNHVKKIRVLMMREEMLAKLLTVSEDDIEFQSSSNFHKTRFKHLKLMAEKWKDMQQAARKAKTTKIPHYDYIGKVQLCVPVSSTDDDDEGAHRPGDVGPAGDPHEVTISSVASLPDAVVNTFSRTHTSVARPVTPHDGTASESTKTELSDTLINDRQLAYGVSESLERVKRQ